MCDWWWVCCGQPPVCLLELSFRVYLLHEWVMTSQKLQPDPSFADSPVRNGVCLLVCSCFCLLPRGFHPTSEDFGNAGSRVRAGCVVECVTQCFVHRIKIPFAPSLSLTRLGGPAFLCTSPFCSLCAPEAPISPLSLEQEALGFCSVPPA